MRGEKNSERVQAGSRKNRILFWIGVTAAGIVLAAAVLFAAGKVIGYFREYFRYASLEGTGVDLEEDGLSGLIGWIGEREDVPEKINVAYMSTWIRETGEVYDFTLSLEAFDEQDQYVKDVRFVYDSRTGELSRSEETVTILPTEYDPNAEAGYLDGQIKRIPLKAQMKMLDFDRYTVEFQKDSQPLTGTLVIDGRDGEAFPVLTWEEYRQGAGGVSDGSSQVEISLTDGTGATGQRIEYLCAASDEAALSGNPETVMETDYRIDNGELLLTDDAGETWISSVLTEEQVQETLETYQKGQEIPENSFCADGSGRFAVFYGEAPVLRVLEQDGAEVRDIPFQENFPRNCVARVIGFLDEENWYAALGTDWSMGTGGAAFVYQTHDAGATWERYPLSGTDGLILTGLVFTDPENGILTMEDAFGNESWPHIYVTHDGGAGFTELTVTWDEAQADGVTFLNKVDRITSENGMYTMTMGQGSYGNKKAEFTAPSLDGEWKFTRSYIGTVHTWG